MTDSEIDDVILTVVETRWHKVARIIIDAAKRLGSRLPGGDEGHEMIGRRIGVLVDDGRLVAQGDVEKWRHSEVRLP